MFLLFPINHVDDKSEQKGFFPEFNTTCTYVLMYECTHVRMYVEFYSSSVVGNDRYVRKSPIFLY